jgi:c-di-GMP-binding flagellar brake protein YcgR
LSRGDHDAEPAGFHYNRGFAILPEDSRDKGSFEAIRMEPKQSRFGTDDRRKHTRYQLSVPIQLSMTDRPTIQGLTLEISEGGLGATTSASLEVGHRMVLTPIGYNAMLAVVRWIHGRAYGFEFLELSSEQQQTIRDHCRKLPLHCSSLDF